MANITTMIANEGMFADPEVTVSSLIEKVKSNLVSKNTTVDAARALSAKLADEAVKFNDCIRQMANAVHEYQAQNISKDEMLAITGPAREELRKNSTALGMCPECMAEDNGPDICECELAVLREFLVGAKQAVDEYIDAVESEPGAEVPSDIAPVSPEDSEDKKDLTGDAPATATESFFNSLLVEEEEAAELEPVEESTMGIFGTLLAEEPASAVENLIEVDGCTYDLCNELDLSAMEAAFELDIEEYELAMEGANTEATTAYKTAAAAYKSSVSAAKKAIKSNDFAAAKSHIEDARSALKKFNSEMQDAVQTGKEAVIGNLLYLVKSLLPITLTFVAIGVGAGAVTSAGAVRGGVAAAKGAGAGGALGTLVNTITNAISSIRSGGKITASNMNTYTNMLKNAVRTLEISLDKVEKNLNKKKARVESSAEVGKKYAGPGGAKREKDDAKAAKTAATADQAKKIVGNNDKMSVKEMLKKEREMKK